MLSSVKVYLAIIAPIVLLGAGFVAGLKWNGARIAELEAREAQWTTAFQHQQANMAAYQGAIDTCTKHTEKLADANVRLTDDLAEAARENMAASQRIKRLTGELATRPLPADPTEASREAVRRLSALAGAAPTRPGGTK